MKLMKHFKLTVLVGATFLVAALGLCACGSGNGKAYSDREVAEFVKQKCPSESYKLISKEKTGDDWYHYEYETERGLVFEVDNHGDIFWLFALFPIPEKYINCNYDAMVNELYWRDAKKILDQYPKTIKESNYGVYINTYADIRLLADQVMMANKVLEPELEYNDIEFIRALRCGQLHIVHYPDDEFILDISACHYLYSDPYSDISKAYLERVKDGRIKDDTVTREMLEDVHPHQLNNLELNGEPFKYEIQKYKDRHFGLDTDRYDFAFYDEETEQYFMPCDIALDTENSAIALVVNEYVTALSGSYNYSYESNYDKDKKTYHNTARWIIDGDIWEMRSEYRSGVKKFEVCKNGENLNIRYVPEVSGNGIVTPHLVGIPLDDFVKLFDLNYSVDEYNSTVSFYSK